MIRTLWTLLILLGLVACQSPPTKIKETRVVDLKALMAKVKSPLRIEDASVIIDARSDFEYTMAHIPGSISVKWDEFVQPRSKYKGELLEDLEGIAKRLALKGIEPQSSVVVLGQGKQGTGEEGRLAWMLYYLGVQDVQFADIAAFSGKFSNIIPPETKNAKEWTPNPNQSLIADRDEILKAATEKITEGRRTAYIIDVRRREEYFKTQNQGAQYATPDIRAIHIDWREFLDDRGRPNSEMFTKLKSIGIRPSDRIIVISNSGLRSGAVTMALLSIGFPRAANFIRGYPGLRR